MMINDSRSLLHCERTVDETILLKDDYENIRQSPFMKFIRRSRSQLRKNYASLHNSPVKFSNGDIEVQNLSLKNV